MDHEHHHCEHEVQFCKDCDTTYCNKCDAEWVKPTKRIAFVITEFGLWFEVVPLDEYDEVMWQMEALWGELREGSE